ncbi:MAG: hypothetical protein ACPGRX_06570, partial [Bdellovibrionales bacterium]
MTDKKPTEAAPHNKRKRKNVGFVLVEILAVVLLLAAFGAGFLAWRLSSGPLDIGFAKDAIEGALSDPQSGLSVRMDDVVLQWPALNGPILIGVRGGRITDADGVALVFVDEAAFGLNKAALLVGRFLPENLIVRRLSVRVVRESDNSFDIGLAGKAGGAQPNDADSLVEQIFKALAQPDTQKSDTQKDVPGRLSALERFSLEGAQVIVEDRVLGTSWTLPRVDAVFESHPDGLIARYSVVFPALSGAVDLAHPPLTGQMFLDRNQREPTLEAELSNFDLRILGEKFPQAAVLKSYNGALDARLAARFDADLNLLSADIRDLRYVIDGVTMTGQGRVERADADYMGSVRIGIESVDQ